jgi:hypothetical protein
MGFSSSSWPYAFRSTVTTFIARRGACFNPNRVFGVDVADFNRANRRAFEKNGYTVDAELLQNPGGKSRVNYDLILTREAYELRPLRPPR